MVAEQLHSWCGWHLYRSTNRDHSRKIQIEMAPSNLYYSHAGGARHHDTQRSDFHHLRRYLRRGVHPHHLRAREIACDKSLTGCCCCGSGFEDVENRCPEWEDYEIISILVLDLKISGITAFGCILYIIGAIIIAVLIRNALANYRSDYVGMGKLVEADDREGAAKDQGTLETSRGAIGTNFMPSFPSSSSSPPSTSVIESEIDAFQANSDYPGSSKGGKDNAFSPALFDPSGGSVPASALIQHFVYFIFQSQGRHWWLWLWR